MSNSFKRIYMRTIFRFSIAFALVFFAAACGSSNKEENKSLAAKKAELDKLKKESDQLNTKITALEEEIAKEDSTAVSNAKLVDVTTLQQQDFTHYIELQGRITTDDISFVTPRGMGGQVKAIYVKEGDYVKDGQLLMKLDNGTLSEQLAQAKLQLNYLKDIYERRKKLWDQNIGTEVELITAKNNVENQQKQIDLLNEQMSYSNVYANRSGIVETVSIRVGETFSAASASQAGITIINPRDMKVSVLVPENYLSRVKKGSNVVVEVPDVNKTINTKISLISQVINANARGFQAEANIPYDASLKPNQLATVKIRDYSAPNTIVIPLTTLQTDNQGKYVFVQATENGKLIAHKKQVEIGEIYGDKIEVKSGLEAGDKLITKGYQSLYEGQVITIDSK